MKGEKKCSVRRTMASAVDSEHGAVSDMKSTKSWASDPVGELVGVLAQRQWTDGGREQRTRTPSVCAPWRLNYSRIMERRPR